MYKVWIKDGTTPRPTDPIYYIVAGNKLFIHKKMQFWSVTVPVESIGVLEDETPGIELLLPPIPSPLVLDMVRFFAWVNDLQNTEAAVLLWYDPAEGTYSITVPSQRVSFGSVHYDIPNQEGGKRLVGSFHSHGSMSAFHSSVDRQDAKTFDGIHGTVGRLGDCRWKAGFALVLDVSVNGTQFPLDIQKYMLGVVPVESKTSPNNTEATKEENNENQGEERHPSFLRERVWRPLFQEDKLYTILSERVVLPPDYDPPAEWKEKVVRKRRGLFSDLAEAVIGGFFGNEPPMPPNPFGGESGDQGGKPCAS